MEIRLKAPEENFLGLDREYSNFENSRIVILPIPFETSTSYGKGTAHGPEEIIKASHQVEYYDIELEREIEARVQKSEGLKREHIHFMIAKENAEANEAFNNILSKRQISFENYNLN